MATPQSRSVPARSKRTCRFTPTVTAAPPALRAQVTNRLSWREIRPARQKFPSGATAHPYVRTGRRNTSPRQQRFRDLSTGRPHEESSKGDPRSASSRNVGARRGRLAQSPFRNGAARGGLHRSRTSAASTLEPPQSTLRGDPPPSAQKRIRHAGSPASFDRHEPLPPREGERGSRGRGAAIPAMFGGAPRLRPRSPTHGPATAASTAFTAWSRAPSSRPRSMNGAYPRDP